MVGCLDDRIVKWLGGCMVVWLDSWMVGSLFIIWLYHWMVGLLDVLKV